MALSTLVYDRAGVGEPLVLIHGIGHRRQAWAPVFDLLAHGYDVIAVDLAGFGESPAYADGVPYTMDNACLDLAQNFEDWGIERPHIVGNSLGGAIALELASRGFASSVIALSPAGFFGRVDRVRALTLLMILWLGSRLPDRALRLAANLAVGRRLIGLLLYAHTDRVDAAASYGDARGMKNAPAFLRTIKAGVHYKMDVRVAVPTTIMWGTKDLILPDRQGAAARRRLPEATHVSLPGAGHVPMVDAPDAIIAAIGEATTRAKGSSAA